MLNRQRREPFYGMRKRPGSAPAAPASDHRKCSESRPLLHLLQSGWPHLLCAACPDTEAVPVPETAPRTKSGSPRPRAAVKAAVWSQWPDSLPVSLRHPPPAESRRLLFPECCRSAEETAARAYRRRNKPCPSAQHPHTVSDSGKPPLCTLPAFLPAPERNRNHSRDIFSGKTAHADTGRPFRSHKTSLRIGLVSGPMNAS